MKNLMSLMLFAIFLSMQSLSAQDQQKKALDFGELWDRIVNKGELELINENNFDKNVTKIAEPENIVGLENYKAYYQQFLKGFSDIEFTIVDGFATADRLAKHWRFKGKHTGDFFGIPPTDRMVDIEGVTLAKMKNGKMIQEHDFMDNAVFLQQLGVVSDPGNVTVVDNLYKYFAAGDIPKVLETLDAKVVWNEAEGNYLADGNPYIGPDAVLKGVFGRIGATHDYFKVKDVQLHNMSNNQVLATLRYEAKMKKNGALIDAQAAHLWTLSDGKVTAFQQYADTRQLAETKAAGSLPMVMSHNFYLPVTTTSAAAKAAYYKAEHLASNIYFTAANAALDQAIETDPDFFMAYALKSFYASDENKPALIDKALAIDTKSFNKAEKIVREQLLAWDKDLKAKTGKHMKALVEAYPNSPQALHWAALHAAYTDKDKDAAIAYAEKLAEMSPDFGANYNTLGYAYMEKNEMDKAKVAFKKYIVCAPQEANAYDSMGEYYMNIKNYEKSAEYYDKAVAMGMMNSAKRAEKARESLAAAGSK